MDGVPDGVDRVCAKANGGKALSRCLTSRSRLPVGSGGMSESVSRLESPVTTWGQTDDGPKHGADLQPSAAGTHGNPREPTGTGARVRRAAPLSFLVGHKKGRA